MNRFQVAALWVCLQVLFFVGWAALEGSRLAAGVGRSILVHTASVDPRDLFRDQYLQLSYEFSRAGGIREVGKVGEASTVWVVLAPQGEFHVPVLLEAERPRNLSEGEVAIQGKRSAGGFEFGIERYFVPEGSPTPSPRDITVRLRVGADGKPRIEKVYVKGAPWP